MQDRCKFFFLNVRVEKEKPVRTPGFNSFQVMINNVLVILFLPLGLEFYNPWPSVCGILSCHLTGKSSEAHSYVFPVVFSLALLKLGLGDHWESYATF